MNWSYIAGFFDGEGNIAIKRHSRNWGYGFPLCRIAQSDAGVLNEIQSFLLSEGIVNRVNPTNNARINCKQHYVLSVDGWLGVTKLLSHMLPYLIVKRTEAQDILRYRRLYPRVPHRDALLKGWETRRARKAIRCLT